jgi:hypothetical protein
MYNTLGSGISGVAFQLEMDNFQHHPANIVYRIYSVTMSLLTVYGTRGGKAELPFLKMIR